MSVTVETSLSSERNFFFEFGDGVHEKATSLSLLIRFWRTCG